MSKDRRRVRVRAPSLSQIVECENGAGSRCRCRCHGLAHGLDRNVGDLMPNAEFFASLPETDPHHYVSPAERRRVRLAEAKKVRKLRRFGGLQLELLVVE